MVANLPTVICIAGIGRSGSTLLERVLVEQAGAFGLGEARYVWERGLRNNELCSCGQNFLDCGFWSRVASDMSDEKTPMDASMADVADRVNRNRRLPMWLWPRLASRRFEIDAEGYTQAVA